MKTVLIKLDLDNETINPADEGIIGVKEYPGYEL
jgi:hypothetical protein